MTGELVETVRRFIQETPSYVASPKNAMEVDTWLRERGLPWTLGNLKAAWRDITDSRKVNE